MIFYQKMLTWLTFQFTLQILDKGMELDIFVWFWVMNENIQAFTVELELEYFGVVLATSDTVVDQVLIVSWGELLIGEGWGIRVTDTLAFTELAEKSNDFRGLLFGGLEFFVEKVVKTWKMKVSAKCKQLKISSPVEVYYT